MNSESPVCIISPETWFFGDMFRSGILKTIHSIGDMKDNNNIGKLIDYMFSGKMKHTYWILLSNNELGIDKTTMKQLLLSTDRSDIQIYRTIMQAYGLAHHKSIDGFILGDKTPGHIYYVDILLGWFPDAKVIHTFRDPRAIVASQWKRKVGERPITLKNLVINPLFSIAVVLYVTITWLRAARLHYKYTKKFPANYYFLKYEDLVLNPELCIQNICEFLGINVNDKMMQPRKVDSSLKIGEGSGFDTDALSRWKSYLNPWIKIWFNLVCSNHLTRFGYKKTAD